MFPVMAVFQREVAGTPRVKTDSVSEVLVTLAKTGSSEPVGDGSVPVNEPPFIWICGSVSPSAIFSVGRFSVETVSVLPFRSRTARVPALFSIVRDPPIWFVPSPVSFSVPPEIVASRTAYLSDDLSGSTVPS